MVANLSILLLDIPCIIVDGGEWWYRLANVEDLARATMKKLTQGMAEHNKVMAAAKTDDVKASIVSYSFIYLLLSC